MTDLGYKINVEELCHNQSFLPSQVVSSELVFPRGAVPNAAIIWIRVELANGERSFVTRSLADFYKLVDLPESSIGGWTEGNKGTDTAMDKRLDIVMSQEQEDGDSRSDHAGHDTGDEAHNSGSAEPISGGVLDGSEGVAAAVET